MEHFSGVTKRFLLLEGTVPVSVFAWRYIIFADSVALSVCESSGEKTSCEVSFIVIKRLAESSDRKSIVK